MKKLISLLMILAVLLSLCACGGQTSNEPTNEPTAEPTIEATEAPTEEKTKPSLEYTPEELYGHIDQTKPNSDGVYKLWNKDGVANMVNVPDGTFELLCNIDMEGATLAPIGTAEAPFTGLINGKNFIISNFALASQGEALGFVGVNNGTIQDLQLEGITATAVAANKYIGTMAGVNKGTILRSKSSGTLTVDAAAADAAIGGGVGANTGDFTNTGITVDVLVNTSEAATVGGIVGTTTSGKVEFIDSYGAITVTGENKTVGLFAGASENTPITTCAFVGADNSLNGELFTNLTNTSDISQVTGCVMRDNTPVEIPKNERKLRETVVQRMYEMVTVEWHLHESLAKSDGIFNKEYTYYGMPYQHKNGTLATFEYVIDEEGYVEDWVYDLPVDLLNGYFGGDCYSTVRQAYFTVSNTGLGSGTVDMYPWNTYTGYLPVGEWAHNENFGNTDTQMYVEATGEQRMYEAYAMLRKGDCYMYVIAEVGGHIRMVADNAVVVRNQNGLIDPNYSYVPSHESGWTTQDSENKTYTACRANYHYTFANLIYDGALPFTIEELVTGEMEPATAELVGAQDGRMGMVSGIVNTNYCIAYMDMVITDSKGNEVFNHRMFPNVSRENDYSATVAKMYVDAFPMGRFATPLSQVNFIPGETYAYRVSVSTVPGDTFEVHSGSFTHGSTE